MPITIQHTPVTLVGGLAAQAGMAQGQLRERSRMDQIKELRYQQFTRQREQETAALERAQVRGRDAQERMEVRQMQQDESRQNRDLQLRQMMLAAQERGASEASARAAQKQTFMLQRGLAAQAAQRPPRELPDNRQQLRDAVAEARRSGIYEPRQIQQMEIAANMGDEASVKLVLRKLPRELKDPVPGLRERELKRQMKAVKGTTQQVIKERRLQIAEIRGVISERYDSPESQAYVKKHPEIMPEDVRDFYKGLFTEIEKIEAEIAEITKKAKVTDTMLQLGWTTAEQTQWEARQAAGVAKAESEQLKRSGQLTEREDLAVDLVQEKYDDMRKSIGRENTRLAKELQPYKDEDPESEEFLARIEPVSAQIDVNRRLIFRSYAQEKQELGSFLKGQSASQPAPKVYTDKTGQKWEFVEYQNGKPMYKRAQ